MQGTKMRYNDIYVVYLWSFHDAELYFSNLFKFVLKVLSRPRNK